MRNCFSLNHLKSIGVKIYGNGTNIEISKLAKIYNPSRLILQDNIRIDDFSILSGRGNIEIGNYVHIGAHCSISSYSKIQFHNYSGLSSGVKLFGSTDDYSGKFMTNPTVPPQFLGTIHGDIILNKHVVIGAGSIILPNTTLAEGTAVGALSLINKNTEAWKIYAGNPAKIIKNREKNCLEYEKIIELNITRVENENRFWALPQSVRDAMMNKKH
jgi:acetyltransferase-like isoleucine patch superfamily enzyme